MAKQEDNTINDKMKKASDAISDYLVDGFHIAALFVIGGTIVWSALLAFGTMVEHRHASIEDILLLFIYLELGAMVGIYFKTKHMPVRFLIYIAITALTRMLIGAIQINHIPDKGIIFISVAILLLALATLVIRYASAKYPSTAHER